VFSGIQSLDKMEKSRLETSALAHVNSPRNPLFLDPTLDNQQMAEHLANLFPELYNLVKTDETVPPGWFYQLIKHQRTLGSAPGQVGASAHQLIHRASTEARAKTTREIYLGELISATAWMWVLSHLSAVPVELTCSLRVKLHLAPPKRSLSDSEDDNEGPGMLFVS
jgi:hypothetical protein